MNPGEENHEFERWYDQDPTLRRALEDLRKASDKYHAQIALNIIKVIIEHQIETLSNAPAEELNRSLASAYHQQDHLVRRRWYDVNETLRSAMQLLQDCPEDLQKSVIPTIAQMIEETLGQKV